jgi:hypothetical protein
MGISLKQYKKNYDVVNCILWVAVYELLAHKIEYSSNLHGILKADTYTWKHQNLP